MSPETIFTEPTVRAVLFRRSGNSIVISVSSSLLAVILGTFAACGLSRFSYKFLWMKNQDISFFFLSQLILPPVVLALPKLALSKKLNLVDTRIVLIALYKMSVLPIVIWIMRDQFAGIPVPVPAGPATA